MHLMKSAQPVQFLILFMVISCWGSHGNSVSLAHQEPHKGPEDFLTPA